MESDPPQTDGRSDLAPRRLDRLSILLGLATLLLVGSTVWLRFAPAPRSEPPAIGETMPPLRLLDLKTAEPSILLGSKGKVTWVVFWSTQNPSATACLKRLDAAWKRLKWHRRLTMVAAAFHSDQPDQVRATLSESRSTVPAYVAGPETLKRIGLGSNDLPLHLVVDGEGRIAALVRGASQNTIDRLERQVRQWLDEIEPLGETRFAGNESVNPPCGQIQGAG